MTLKPSFKNGLKPIIRMVLIVAFIFFVGFLYAGGYDQSLLPGFIIIICIPVLPTIYLLIEYYIVSKNQLVTITNDSISIVNKNGDNYHYKFDELKCIKLYKSAGMEKGSFPFQTAEMFYHAEIFATDNKKIVLTSLLKPSIDGAIAAMKCVDLEVIRTVYSTIYI